MPDPAHNRHSTRLLGYDYAQAGGYYVTIVTRGRETTLGTVIDGVIILSNQGHAVLATWNQIPQHFPNVVLDEFVIMPIHMHGIIMIVDEGRAKPGVLVGSGRGKSGDGVIETFPSVDLPLRADRGRGLPEMIRAFKSFSARKINQMDGTTGQPFWQRNYYEHIIRGEAELQKIREYIHHNPLQWELDKENPQKGKP